jgi:5-(carboxyamino)imidazole ribonucleotide synthase
MQKNWYGKSSRLGILGGGQLGRMFIQEAINLDVDVHILDPDENAPCKDISTSFTKGSLLDFDTVYSFGKDKDILTVEIENVNTEALEKLEKEGKKVFPQPHLLRLVQDKGLQKEFYSKNNLPTAIFHLIDNKASISNFISSFPLVQKLRKGGYDGKGVQVLRTIDDLDLAFDAPSILEEMIPFKKELSVIVARNEKGETAIFPTVECEFNPEANLVELLFSPASVSEKIEEEAQSLAKDLIEKLNLVGILAVELFLTEDDKLLINEIAPRPHNSGHHTIECNVTSQFEQHLRAILNLPLGNTRAFQAGAMVNLLGAKGYEGTVYYDGLEEILAIPGVQPHIYGKSITKPFRKMGHITISGDCVEDVISLAKKVLTDIQVISK